MTMGQTVYVPDGRRGVIVGWRGDAAIVSLEDGVYLELPVAALRAR